MGFAHPREIATLCPGPYSTCVVQNIRGIIFKLFLTFSYQYTSDVYKGVRFVQEISTSLFIYEIFEFFKISWTYKKKNTIPTQIKMKLLLAQIIILGEAEPTCSMQ